MTEARVVLSLTAALAALAAGVLGLAFSAAASSVSFHPSSPQALAVACSRFALPDVSVASVAVLSLGSLAVAVVVLSVRSLARQVRATRRFLAALRVTGAGPAGSLIFAGDTPQAFCAGLLRPQAYVSDAAIEALYPDELQAVLAHESHHRQLRDPLRFAIAQAVSEGLFFLPAARRLAQRYGALAELAADGAAMHAWGAPPLAAALLAFERADPAVVGISPARVDHLLGDRPAWELPLALIIWSVAVLTAAAAGVWRLDAAASDATFNLSLVAAQSCMLLMAGVPVLLGASAILAARRLVRAPG